MPDWFYRTVSQPILFRFSAPRARDFALGFMGGLARLPLGPFLIDFLGHMRADPRLRRTLLDTTFPTAIGLGPWLDPNATATEALSRFGIGFIEIAYIAAIAVHFVVGYLNFHHLFPAFGGLALLLVGLLLSYPFLCRKSRDPV